MGWLLELLFGAVKEMCVQIIVDLMDMSSSMFTELLSCDLDLFEDLFGVVGDLYNNVIMPIGIMLLLMILVWQLFKGMFGRLGAASEDPVELIFRSAACLIFIAYSRDVVNYILNLAGTPYQWVTGTSIPVASFSSYVSTAEGLVSAIGIDALSISLLSLILQFVVAWNYFKMMFILAERYVLLGVFSYTAPLAFATGASKATSGILASWVKMFGGQVLIIILDAWCMKMFLSAYGNLSASMYGFTKFFAATMCLVGFCKITAKLDSYMGSLGVNLGRSGGGMGGMGALLMAGRLLHMGGGFGKGAGGGTAGSAGPKPGTGGKPGPGPMDFGNGKGIPLGNAPVSDADKMPGQADLLGGNGFGKDNLSPDHSLGLENFGKENAGPAFAPLDGDAVSGNQSGKPFGEPERNPMVEDGMGNLPESAETGGLFPETSGIPAGENRENTPELSEESGPGAVDETGTIPLSDGEQERTWSENAGGISALDDAGTGTWDTGTGIESYGETAGGASLGSDMSGIDGSDSGMVAETEGISGFVGNEIGALPSAPEGGSVGAASADGSLTNPDAALDGLPGMSAASAGTSQGVPGISGGSHTETAGGHHSGIEAGGSGKSSGKLPEGDMTGGSRGGTAPQFAELGRPYGSVQPTGGGRNGHASGAGTQAGGGASYLAERDGKRYMRYDAGHYEKPQGAYQTIHENGKTYYELPEGQKAPNLLPETRATLQKDGTLHLEKVYQPENGRNQENLSKVPVQEIPSKKQEGQGKLQKAEKKPGKAGRQRKKPGKKRT